MTQTFRPSAWGSPVNFFKRADCKFLIKCGLGGRGADNRRFPKELLGVHGEGMAPEREGSIGWCEFSGPVWKALFSCPFLFRLSLVETVLLSGIALELNGGRRIGGCAAFCSCENVEKYAASKHFPALSAGWEETIQSREMFGEWEGDKTMCVAAFLQLLFSRFSHCVNTLY